MFFTLTNKSYLGLFGDPFFWGGGLRLWGRDCGSVSQQSRSYIELFRRGFK